MNDRAIGSIILEGGATAEDVIIADSNNKKRVIAEGTLQDMDVENRNHRIYAKADMLPEVNGPRIKELIASGTLKGEYGHPLSDDLVRQQSVMPALAAVKYLKLWVEGNRIKAQFRGTNTNYGDYFDADLRDGERPAFSLRALGSIENIGGKAYVKGIHIITWDTVIYPSHKVAYTDKIISEAAMDGTPVSTNQLVVPEDDPGTIITLTESDARTVINRLQRESANLTKIVETFDGLYDKISLVNESTVMMSSKYGEKIYINLEDHIDNLIMDFAYRN